MQELILRALDLVVFDIKEYSSMMDLLNILALHGAENISIEKLKSIIPAIFGEKFREEELEERLEKINSKTEFYELLLKLVERDFSDRLALLKSRRAKIAITHIALKRLAIRGGLSDSLRELEEIRENYKSLEISDVVTLLRIYQALALGYAYLGFFDRAIEYIRDSLSIASITGNLPEVLITLERVINLYSSATRISQDEEETLKAFASLARSLYKIIAQSEYISSSRGVIDYIKDLLRSLRKRRLKKNLEELLDSLEKVSLVISSLVAISRAPRQ